MAHSLSANLNVRNFPDEKFNVDGFSWTGVFVLMKEVRPSV